MKYVIIIFLVFSFGKVYSQEKALKHSINFSLGLGLEDGFRIETYRPVIGIHYIKFQNKYLFFTTSLSSYYRTYFQFYSEFQSIGLGGEDAYLIDLYLNSPSIFLTADLQQEIESKGIRSFEAIKRANKVYTLTFDACIGINILNIQKHRVGFYLGPAINYENYKWYWDQIPGYLELENGESYLIQFFGNKEERSINIGSKVSLVYEFITPHYNIGINFGSTNLVFSSFLKMGINYWNTSITIGKNF